MLCVISWLFVAVGFMLIFQRPKFIGKLTVPFNHIVRFFQALLAYVIGLLGCAGLFIYYCLGGEFARFW